MTSRERVLMALNHKEPDRVPIHDIPWGATLKRWRKEGLPEEDDVADYFGYEFVSFGVDITPRYPVKTIEKNENFIVATTPAGGRRKNFIDYSTTPEVIDWPVKSKDDWREIRKRLEPDYKRVDWANGLRNNQTRYDEGKFLTFGTPCGYDALQAYMNSENLLILMATDPEWVKEMVTVLARLIVEMADMMIAEGFRFDAAFLYNDMGYRNGLLFSPKSYMETHYEADSMMFDFFHSKGMKTILHSCGRVKELIPILAEAGLDCLQPLEVKAGMDLVELKEEYGDIISFMGGIDVRVMADENPARIEEEIKRKITAAKKGGGYIYHSDHSIPKNISLERYKKVLELVRRYGSYEA